MLKVRIISHANDTDLQRLVNQFLLTVDEILGMTQSSDGQMITITLLYHHDSTFHGELH